MTDARYPSAELRFSIVGYVGLVTALIDTGCDADLVVPARLVADLPPPSRIHLAETASGERLYVPAYRGQLELPDHTGAFDAWVVALGDEYLLGLPALNRFRVTLDHGQRLIIER